MVAAAGDPSRLIFYFAAGEETVGEIMQAGSIAVAAIALLQSCTFSGVDGATKRWTPNVDFEEPANWDAGRVPSFVDTATFPADTAVPVVLPSAGVAVCRMVLPANGQVVFEPNARIAIAASPADGCTGHNVTFRRNVPLKWVDPENWSSPQVNGATPHVERIPCQHDTVVFDPSHSFSVVVPDLPISVGSVKFGNQTFDQNDLDEFVASDVGDQELRGASPNSDPSIALTSPTCADPAGCDCGTAYLLNAVCGTASARCADDDRLGCVDPVKPTGHCCRICGAFFVMSYESNFSREKFDSTFKKDLIEMKQNDGKYHLVTHTGKLSDGKIQIVLASGTKYVDEIHKIAKSVHSLLIAYTESGMGIADVRSFISGPSYEVDGMTYGKMALITCAIVMSGMAAIIVYYTESWKSLQLFVFGSNEGAIFVKFENETNDVEMINEDVRLQRKSSFDNPTYGAVQEDMSQPQTSFPISLSYADLSTSNVRPINAIDLELTETSKQ